MIKNSSKPSDGHSNPPSSRPMTLRQQLTHILGTCSGIDSHDCQFVDDDNVMLEKMVELCHEIAREAYDKGYDDCLEEHGAVFKKEQE